MLYTRECPICKEENTLMLTEGEALKYELQKDEKNIQDIFPRMNPGELEFLRYGHCPSCQEKIFGTTDKPSERFV